MIPEHIENSWGKICRKQAKKEKSNIGSP